MTLLTSKDAAEQDGCEPVTARKWAVKNGVKLVGDRYIWTLEEIEAFCNRNKQRGWQLGRARKNIS